MKTAFSRATWSWLLVVVSCAAMASGAEPQCNEVPDCGSCMCESCCAPAWTVVAGLVVKQRSRPNPRDLVTDSSQPGGTVLTNAADYNFDFEAGPDLRIIRQGREWGVEFHWFQVHDWIATTPVTTSPTGAFVQYVTPIGDLDASDISSRYQSWLDSFELNLRKPVNCWLTGLVGFRYMQLSELGLTITQDARPNMLRYSNNAINELYGAQVGLDGKIWDRCGKFRIEGLLKLGIYGDDARNRILITRTNDQPLASAAATTHASFVGELEFTAVYDVSDRVAVRVGYELLWIQGVALASDQIAVSDPANGVGGIDLTGSPFYHGVTAGVEVRW